MPAWQPQAFSAVATAVTIPTTTETVVATLSGVSVNESQKRLALRGCVSITTGAGTTTITTRIRRGATVAGTLVSTATAEAITTAAGSTETHCAAALDTPGELAVGDYVLTAQQAAAGANGTAVWAQLEATLV